MDQISVVKLGSHYGCCSLILSMSYYKDLRVIKTIVDESALVVIQNSITWTQFFASNVNHTSCSMMIYCLCLESYTFLCPGFANFLV